MKKLKSYEHAKRKKSRAQKIQKMRVIQQSYCSHGVISELYDLLILVPSWKDYFPPFIILHGPQISWKKSFWKNFQILKISPVNFFLFWWDPCLNSYKLFLAVRQPKIYLSTWQDVVHVLFHTQALSHLLFSSCQEFFKFSLSPGNLKI